MVTDGQPRSRPARERTILLLESLQGDVVRDLTAALEGAPGVTRVYVDTGTEAVLVEHTERVTSAELARIVELLGLCCSGLSRQR